MMWSGRNPPTPSPPASGSPTSASQRSAESFTSRDPGAAIGGRKRLASASASPNSSPGRPISARNRPPSRSTPRLHHRSLTLPSLRKASCRDTMGMELCGVNRRTTARRAKRIAGGLGPVRVEDNRRAGPATIELERSWLAGGPSAGPLPSPSQLIHDMPAPREIDVPSKQF